MVTAEIREQIAVALFFVAGLGLVLGALDYLDSGRYWMGRGVDEIEAMRNLLEALEEKVEALEQKGDERHDDLKADVDFAASLGVEKLDAVEEKVGERLDALEEKASERLDALEEKIGERLDALEESLDLKLGTLDEKIDSLSLSDDPTIDLP